MFHPNITEWFGRKKANLFYLIVYLIVFKLGGVKTALTLKRCAPSIYDGAWFDLNFATSSLPGPCMEGLTSFGICVSNMLEKSPHFVIKSHPKSFQAHHELREARSALKELTKSKGGSEAAKKMLKRFAAKRTVSWHIIKWR